MEPTGQVTCRFHQIRHKIQVNYTVKWISFSGQVKMKQADIWFHVKNGFYILIEYADLIPLGIPIVKSNLA
jgi:hypothetical protein